MKTLTPRTIVVVAAVAVACVIGLLVVGRMRSGQRRAADPAMYAGLRTMALSASRQSLGLPASSRPVVALMDIATDDYTLTVVATDDGSASIYFSNGGGLIGGGQRHDAIRQAALEMIGVAGQSVPQMALVKEYPLPGAGQTSFYVVTDAGVLSATAPTRRIEGDRSHPLRALYAAGQDVITQYRRSQQGPS